MGAASKAWLLEDKRTCPMTLSERKNMATRLEAEKADVSAFLSSIIPSRAPQSRPASSLTIPLLSMAISSIPASETIVLIPTVALFPTEDISHHALLLTPTTTARIDDHTLLAARPAIVLGIQAVLAALRLSRVPSKWVDPIIAAWVANPDAGGYTLQEQVDLTSIITKQPKERGGLAHAAAVQLWGKMVTGIRRWGLRSHLMTIEMPLAALCSTLTNYSYTVDPVAVDEMIAAYQTELDGHIAEFKACHPAAGTTNPNSPQQLAVLLYDVLKMKPVAGRATHITALKQLADAAPHPVIDIIINIRKCSKLLSTFLTPYKDSTRATVGWSQVRTGTGRVQTIGGLPVQQMPPAVRNMLIPASGKVWVGADYVQIEAVIAATISGDERLLAMTQTDDVHRCLAAEVFGIPPAQVTTPQRAVAKRFLYGMLYGMSERTLIAELGGDALQSIKQILKGLDSWRSRVESGESGFVRTQSGRPRFIDERRHTRAVNSIVQGSAGDLLRLAAVRLHGLFTDSGLGQIVMMLHDEIIVECQPRDVDATGRMMRRAMTEDVPYRCRVVLKVYPSSWGAGQVCQINETDCSHVTPTDPPRLW